MALDPNDPYALATWDEDLEARFLAGVGTPYGVDPMVQPAPMQITAPVGAPPQEAPAAAIAQPLTPQEEQQIEIDQPAPPVQEPTLADAYSNVIPFAIGSATHPDDEQAPAPTMESEIGLADQFTNLIPSAIGSARNPMTDDELSQDALNDKYTETALTDPAKYAEITAKQDLAREEHLANRMLEEADADRKRLADNFKIEQEARAKHKQDSAKLDAEAQALAEEDIDGDRWMDSRSTLQTIAAFTAAIVGGLNQHNTGGRNMGLEAIEREIDRDVEIQKANLAKRERLLGMRRDAAQSTFQTEMEASRSAEVHRQALYQQAIRGLQVEMQKYDPRGTTWRRIADNAADMQARQQAARAKWEQQNFENELKLQEFGLKNRDQLLKEQKEAKKGMGGTGIVRRPEYFAALDLPAPPWPMTDKDYDKWRSRTKGEKDAKSTDKNADNLQKYGVGGIQYADGSPFIAQGTPEAVEDVRKKVAAARYLTGLIDEARRLRTGYSSSATNRAEWKKLKTNWAAARGVAKDLLGLGALSGDDYTLMNEFLGSDDPTAYASQAPGIEQARKNIVRMARVVVEGHDPHAGSVRAIKFDIPDLQGQEAVDSEAQKTTKELVKGKQGGDYKVNPGETGGDAWDRAKGDAARAKDLGLTSGSPISEREVTTIDEFASRARSGDAEALAALANMAKVGDGAVKEYAEMQLQALATPTIPATESASGAFDGARTTREKAPR
jgi:hypothetical protein